MHRRLPWRAALAVSLVLHALAAVLVGGLRPPAAPPEPLTITLVDLVPAPGDGGSEPASAGVAGPPAPPAAEAPPVEAAPPPPPSQVPRPDTAPAPPPLVATRRRPTPRPAPRPLPSRPAPPAETTAPGGIGSAPSPPPGVAAGGGSGVTPGAPGGDGDAPIAARAAAVPPALVERVLPEYPPAARRRSLEGVVLVEVVVDRSGHVEPPSVRVVRSMPLFDAAATEAVRRWRFRPGRDARGIAVRVLLEVPIRFALR